MANIPSIADLSKYQVNRPGEGEALRQTLYDFQTYDAAGQTQLQFFQQPKGQGGKTLNDTNMTIAGMLPRPQAFLIQSVEIYLLPDLDVGTDASAITSPVASEFSNDVYTVSKSGHLVLRIGSKDYLQEAPIGRFPPKTNLKVENSASLGAEPAGVGVDNMAIQYDYAAFGGRPYFVDPWLLLEANQDFAVELNWAAAVPLPSGVDARIGVVMDGILYRLSQ